MPFLLITLMFLAALPAFAESPEDRTAALDRCLTQHASSTQTCVPKVLSFCETSTDALEKQFCLSRLGKRWHEEFSETLKQAILSDDSTDWDWLASEYLVRASSLETRCRAHVRARLDVLNLQDWHGLSTCNALVAKFSKHLLTDQSEAIEAWREAFLEQVGKTTTCVLDAHETELGKFCIGLFRDWHVKGDNERMAGAAREIVLWKTVSRRLGFSLIEFESDEPNFDQALQMCENDVALEACAVEVVAASVLERMQQP